MVQETDVHAVTMSTPPACIVTARIASESVAS
jgi:hypothetical protein